MKMLTKQSKNCPYLVKQLPVKEGVKGGPYFPTIIVQKNFSGPNSQGGLNFGEFMVAAGWLITLN